MQFDAEAERPDAARIALTMVLLNGKGQVLDVVTARPFADGPPPDREPWPFEIRTVMPVVQPVKDVKVWAVLQ